MMYSDESMLRGIRSASIKVRRPVRINRSDPRYTVKTVKHPAQVIVWGCFSGVVEEVASILLPKGQMTTGDTYKKVLEDYWMPFMELHQATHFQLDGAPCHKNKKI